MLSILHSDSHNPNTAVTSLKMFSHNDGKQGVTHKARALYELYYLNGQGMVALNL
jgi:hypothetical protein